MSLTVSLTVSLTRPSSSPPLPPHLSCNHHHLLHLHHPRRRRRRQRHHHRHHQGNGNFHKGNTDSNTDNTKYLPSSKDMSKLIVVGRAFTVKLMPLAMDDIMDGMTSWWLPGHPTWKPTAKTELGSHTAKKWSFLAQLKGICSFADSTWARRGLWSTCQLTQSSCHRNSSAENASSNWKSPF